MLTLIGIVAAAIAVAVVANWKFHFFKLDLLDEINSKKNLDKNSVPVKVTEQSKTVAAEPVVARVEEPKVEVKTEIVTPERAKDSDGKFVKDNPVTPANEAWVGGVAPAKKAPPARKPAAKKATAAKKPASKK